MPVAEPVVDWSSVVEVIWTSLLGGIGVTAIFALLILGVTRSAELRRNGNALAATGYGVLAMIALVVVAAAVVFGIAVMTHK